MLVDPPVIVASGVQGKLFEVSTTRLLFAGSETRDWSIVLLLAEGRVMSAVAWLRFCSRSVNTATPETASLPC